MSGNRWEGRDTPHTDPARFFAAPASPRHRQYEALRAFFVEGRPSADVARAFGYTPSSFRVLCHHFRHDPRAREFFIPTAAILALPRELGWTVAALAGFALRGGAIHFGLALPAYRREND